MLSLSDKIVAEAAKQLPVSQRSRFLELVAQKKQHIPNVNMPLVVDLARRELLRVTGPSN